MKAIKVAVFFDWMKNVMVSFSVDELQNTTFRSHFGAVGLGDTQERNGFFLAAYIIDNSVLQDSFMEGVRTYLMMQSYISTILLTKTRMFQRKN